MVHVVPLVKQRFGRGQMAESGFVVRQGNDGAGEGRLRHLGGAHQTLLETVAGDPYQPPLSPLLDRLNETRLPLPGFLGATGLFNLIEHPVHTSHDAVTGPEV